MSYACLLSAKRYSHAVFKTDVLEEIIFLAIPGGENFIFSITMHKCREVCFLYTFILG